MEYLDQQLQQIRQLEQPAPLVQLAAEVTPFEEVPQVGRQCGQDSCINDNVSDGDRQLG
jgi:hypothetical protein